MEGYLKKWINILFRWQTRYFIIHEGVLIYCLFKDKPKKGQVHLSICAIRQVPSDQLRIVVNYGMNEMHLRASSVQEQQKWYETLVRAQEQFTTPSTYSLLNFAQRQPFDMISGAPQLNLNQIHTNLTKIWQTQALLQEKLSVIRGPESIQLQSISSQLKDLVTTCAQQVDQEYKKLLIISDKLKEKIRETNDQNPPDNQDDLEDESPPEVKTEFESFCDDDEFLSCNNEVMDHNTIPDNRRPTIRMENVGLLSNSSKGSVMRQQSFQPLGSQSIQELLERIKVKQPIKYQNMIANEAFKDMNLGIEEIREFLPCFKDPNEKVRLFSLIKDMVGKDLTKITFPVTFNEPISMLQSFCENLEYSKILDTANQQADSCLRMAYVMAFSVSSYSSTINRVKKPFNPILGETFEFQNANLRFIAEQISHHPPISAGFGESENFEFYGDTNLKTQFWGKSIEITPLSYFYVRLKKNKDFIHYMKAKSALKNLIMGTQYLDNYGQMNFVNRTNNDQGQLLLNERGWNGGGAYQLKGSVKDSSGVVKYIIQGQWDTQIIAINAQTKQETILWRRNPLPKQYEQQYYFTTFTISLNHLTQQLLHKVGATDSRLRPDQRALENGNIEVAANEKTRLEQKQRLQKTEGKQHGIEHQPMWFKEETDQLTHEKVFIYKGTYWSEKENQYPKGPDIY